MRSEYGNVDDEVDLEIEEHNYGYENIDKSIDWLENQITEMEEGLY
jgi:hypothetical protein